MKNILTLALFLVLLSCNKPKETDEIPQSIQTIISSSWPDCVCLPYINKYKWQGQVVYVLAYRGPACSWTPGYFNKDGEPMVMATDYSFDEFLVESLLLGLVWECE